MRSCNVVFRRLIEQSVVLRNLIKLLAVLGVCLVIAGPLYPAVVHHDGEADCQYSQMAS